MSGEVLNMAIADAKEIMNGEFAVELTITPSGLSAVTINGLATRHSQGFDTDLLPIVSDNAHCTFSEKDLNDEGIVTRNSKGHVDIKDWKVSWIDAIGQAIYKFGEAGPDRTLGLIRVKLSLFE